MVSVFEGMGPYGLGGTARVAPATGFFLMMRGVAIRIWPGPDKVGCLRKGTGFRVVAMLRGSGMGKYSSMMSLQPLEVGGGEAARGGAVIGSGVTVVRLLAPVEA